MVLLALLPVAAAGPVPAIYFLGEDEAGAKVLTNQQPESENHTYGLIAPSLSGPSLWFGGAGPVAEHLRGPIIIAVWPEAGSSDGNVTAGLYLDTGEGPELIAQSGLPLQFDPEQVPEPTALVPPDPSDPEGAIMHVLAQVYPVILQAPWVFEIGPVDVAVPEDATLSIGFGLESPNLIPVGASLIKYGSATAPSFVYVPWFTPDPVPSYPPPPEPAGSGWEPEEATGPASPPATPPATPPASGADDPPAKGEDSPSVGALIIVATLIAVALVLRRP